MLQKKSYSCASSVGCTLYITIFYCTFILYILYILQQHQLLINSLLKRESESTNIKVILLKKFVTQKKTFLIDFQGRQLLWYFLNVVKSKTWRSSRSVDARLTSVWLVLVERCCFYLTMHNKNLPGQGF